MARLGMALLLVAAVGACDPAKLRHTPDAKPIDGAPDAVPHGMVTVKVYDPNTPGTIAVGIPVVFVEADGTIVGRPSTDTNGVAMADVHLNATATAVITTQNNVSMSTIAGIQPGDNIVLNSSQPNGQNGMFNVTFPQYPGATYHYVYGPCGANSGTGSTTLYMYSYCKQDTMDLVVVAYNSSFVPIAYFEKPGVTYTNGGSTALTGTYSFVSTFNASITNVDPTVQYVYMRRAMPAGNGFSESASGMPMSGMLPLSMPAIQGATASVETQASKGQYANRVIQNIAGSSLTYGVDLGATLLPWVGPVTLDLDKKMAYVPTDTTGTTHDKPDFFSAEVYYYRDNGAGGQTGYYWRVIAPQIGDVPLPPLPPEVGDVMPKTTDSVAYTFGKAYESSTLTWDQARVNALDIINTFETSVDTSTRVRESYFQSGD
ncbi:MAG: hypothetical protein JO257_13240 [Deltaproteobacteria bacterium]|nr:hypothetical protein [Deltaproteobacteria bacterium]